MTALMYASENGHTEIVKAFLAVPSIHDINMKDEVRK